MDFFNRFNKLFTDFYEGLFLSPNNKIIPADVCRAIAQQMRDEATQGVDKKMYVPNLVTLTLQAGDEKELEYLRAFLNKGELTQVIEAYCKENNYHFRYPLGLCINISSEVRDVYNKLQVDVSFGKVLPPSNDLDPEGNLTRFANNEAKLEITPPTGKPFAYPLQKSVTRIGRASGTNDIAIPTDNKMSRNHAILTQDPDGNYHLEDKQSTNKTRINGKIITKQILNDGDIILLGRDTRAIFHCTQHTVMTIMTSVTSVNTGQATSSAYLVWKEGDTILDTFPLKNHNILGRSQLECTIYLTNSSISKVHTKINQEKNTFEAQSLDKDNLTYLNSTPIPFGEVQPLQNDDILTLGNITLQFRTS